MFVELIGTFALMWAIMGAAVNVRAEKAGRRGSSAARWAAMVMCFGPLTGAGFNPARSFGPALVGDDVGGQLRATIGRSSARARGRRIGDRAARRALVDGRRRHRARRGRRRTRRAVDELGRARSAAPARRTPRA